MGIPTLTGEEMFVIVCGLFAYKINMKWEVEFSHYHYVNDVGLY
jgi:hypothetical protein